MSTSTKPNHRPLVALFIPKKVGDLIAYALSIAKAMTGNAAYPAPDPTIAVLEAAIADLQSAETAALTRAKGAVVLRNTKREALIALLQQEKGYVQKVADGDLENGAAIISSSGMVVRKTATRAPRTFVAEAGPVSGSAKLATVAASRRASYEWGYSSDGGKTWITAPSTLQAKTVMNGLAVGSTVLFRSRPVTKTGEGDWSQSVALVVK